MFRTKTIPVAIRHAFFQQSSRHARRQLTRRKWQSGGVLLTMLLLAGIFATITALADGGTTTLVSVNSAGTAGGGDSPSISADGRYVAFSSGSNLTANDTNEREDVFVRDTQSGTTTLISVNNAGMASTNGRSYDPSISSDGRYVAFGSSATNLTANDTNGWDDIFVRDLQSGTTTLVSLNSAGISGGNAHSFEPSISSDGRYVTFHSQANNLTANDTNLTSDVFVRDTQSGTTTLVSVNSAGTAGGNGGSTGLSSISADGRYVAFSSGASNLTTNDTNSTADVFVRDTQTNMTTLVSVNSAGTAGGNNPSNAPSISADGRHVAFQSQASNLTVNDTNFTQDVFVRELSPAPAQIQFDAATYTVAENGTNATVTVTRSGNLTASITVNYATSDGTAFAGSDYDSTTGTLTFAANETAQTFTVPITNDSTTETSETINLTLSSPSSGAALGTPSTATLTITDAVKRRILRRARR